MASSVAGRPVKSAGQLVACPSDEQLLAFIPGELEPNEASSLSAHLAACTSCQTRLTTLRHPSKAGPIEPTTPPSRLDQAPALPPGGSDAPTTLLPQPRLRMPERIGQYQLLKQIGRGGMGLVFLAQHVRLGRQVAVKVLPGLHHSDKSAIVRLQREIAAAGRLQHPNIVFATDANEEDGIDYLVMEHIEGIDLSRLVAAAGPLPCPDACEIIRQAALGLAHIHSCCLVHRDLKPSNLMLTSGGVVKILDLGLALLREGRLDNEESATQTGYLLGTADYVSPEQLHDPHDADVRSDLYSLGCTFYKLLTGRAPFGSSEHSTLAKKLDAHRFVSAEPIRTLRPEVPEEVEAILARLLAKEPSDRIQEPAELATLLAPHSASADLLALYVQFGDQAEIDDAPLPVPIPPDASTRSQGRSPTPSQRLRHRPQRRAWRGMLTGALSFALAAGLIALGWAYVTGGLSSPGDDETPGTAEHGTQTISDRGVTSFDLTRPQDNIEWFGYRRSPAAVYSSDHRMLEVHSDSYQLIPIGAYDGRPGSFEVTIQQSPWHGDAGLFFGYRLEPRDNKPPLSTFQLFWLHHYPISNPQFVRVGERLRIVRERAIIQPAEYLDDEIRTFQQVEIPKRQRVRLRVQFGLQRCEKVFLDDQLLADLTTDDVNAQFGPDDYIGLWGLYSHRGDFGSHPTWFGNLTFTPAEK